jgi:hypothetical protein
MEASTGIQAAAGHPCPVSAPATPVGLAANPTGLLRIDGMPAPLHCSRYLFMSYLETRIRHGRAGGEVSRSDTRVAEGLSHVATGAEGHVGLPVGHLPSRQDSHGNQRGGAGVRHGSAQPAEPGS